MTAFWAGLVAGCFVAAVGTHALACRIPLRADRVTRFVVLGGITGGFLVLALAQRYGLLTVHTVSGALLYGFLSELYIFLFTMTVSSISSNLLVRLRAGDLTAEEIDGYYDSRAMVRNRVERLLSTGFLSRDGTRLTPTRKGLRLIRMLQGLRVFFGHQ
jgi:hypothetical protein